MRDNRGIDRDIGAIPRQIRALWEAVNALRSERRGVVDHTHAGSYEPVIPTGTSAQYVRGDKTLATLDKAAVGLGNVDNTTDANKPVSTATQTALNLKANLASPTFTGTVGGVTKTMVGLGNVDNTSDTAKPVSTAQQTAINAALKGVSGRNYKTVLGVIRNAGSGSGYWQPINDSGHQPTLIDSVSTSTTAITITHSTIGASKVSSFIAVPDETLAAAGFTVGASVDLTSTTLYLSRQHPTLTDYVSYNGTTWTSNNSVFTGLTFTTGTLVASHPTLAQAAVWGLAAVPKGAVYRIGVPTVDFSSVSLQFIDGATGAVATTANTNMGVFLTRGGHFEAAINPQSVDTTAFPGSNIWIFGVFEA